ncbi:putative phage portal protein (plasmid) [Selenomonas ruminantium subsp. lactilytica TAM6421]|uniref:Putative phage portal protein n=1 Tax=Selenomonas ruminantium subsp. lactilytica (strain NBRC 103574 / TAM6421) TaxID=927704 RepID=I0GWQ8_SELRL|nr:phage portal protein [Selenomonas ruminantium]BAL85195.1 putative phage portal protein [Selenomonas ruminantium subsp. lactilytica TAM6421]
MNITKELRSTYNRIFHHDDEPPEVVQNTQRLQFLNDWQNVFSMRSDYSNDIVVQSCVRTIARHISKLRANHVVLTDNTKKPADDDNLRYMLQVAPNPYMTVSDFQYRMCINALTTNNAYAVIVRDDRGKPVELWPIEGQEVEVREVENEPYLTFRFSTGKKKTVAYSDLLHIRYNFASGELIAKSNDNLTENLRLLDTLQQSFRNSAVNSGKIRGVASIAGQIGSDQWAKKSEALNAQLQNASSGGIVATDGTITFTPYNGAPIPADHSQLDYLRQNIYRLYGVSDAIVSGKYNEADWTAFMESVLEPLALQMSQEYSRKLFSRKEQLQGNQIVFDMNRLAYCDTRTKTELIRQLRPLGILTTNQCLEIMDLPPVENGGDDRVQTLNVANTNIVSNYQLQNSSGRGPGRPANPPQPDREEGKDNG